MLHAYSYTDASWNEILNDNWMAAIEMRVSEKKHIDKRCKKNTFHISNTGQHNFTFTRKESNVTSHCPRKFFSTQVSTGPVGGWNPTKNFWKNHNWSKGQLNLSKSNNKSRKINRKVTNVWKRACLFLRNFSIIRAFERKDKPQYN